MLKSVIIWGARGYAKVLRELVERIGFAIFDNDSSVAAPFREIPVFYGLEGFQRWRTQQADSTVAGLVAIGGAGGKARLEIQRLLESYQVMPLTAVHPTCFVSGDTVMGSGCHVLAHATICADVRMGDACMINTASTVDHECVLGDGVHIASGATLAGCVTVGSYSMIGAGAVVLPHLRIGTNVIVGGGAVVTKDIPDNHVVCGNPARFLRKRS
jgi:sugar O-acyltransferase (sialic acid O-acetyltransferase NeuD family)